MAASIGAAAATDWLARIEQFDVVGSTNDIVGRWLDEGVAEVCIAVADEQTAGRGRNGRTWIAPSGAALLCSLGFRPTYLGPDLAWHLAAIVSLAMADAVEAVSGRPHGTVRLKWPNDLVVVEGDAVRKLAGVLGETVGLGTDDPRAVIGIGVNAGWDRADFPPDLANAMTSVAELSGQAATVFETEFRDRLFSAFLDRLGQRYAGLRSGLWLTGEWRDRQVTNGTVVQLERPDGSAETVLAIDVDAESGALVIESLSGEWQRRSVTVGEIRHLRLAGRA